MQAETQLDFFSKAITDAVKRREYPELEFLMRDIFEQENKIVLLAELSDRLTSLVFEALLLCGLPYLLSMQMDEYRQLYQLSRGRGIAIYQISRFLIVHAGVHKQVLQRLCSDYREIQDIDQFRPYLEEAKPLPPNQNMMCELIYRDYKIPAEKIVRFKEKFSMLGSD